MRNEATTYESSLQSRYSSTILTRPHFASSQDLVVYVNSVSILNRITEYSDSIIREKYGEKGISESESRAFYSDVVQRSGKFSEGSLTVLLELQDDVSLDEYDPSGFNEKDAARLSVLKDKGVKITDRILEKLSINRPGNWGEEFISLSDGQVVWNGQGIIDVKKSNTRVGVGTGLEKSRAMCEEFVEVGGNGVRVRILQEIDGVEGERGILDAMEGEGGVEETRFKVVWGLEGGGKIGDDVWKEWNEWRAGAGGGVDKLRAWVRARINK